MTEEKQRIIYRESKRLYLRPLSEETDLIRCQKWMNDPEVSQFVLVTTPMTLQNERDFLTRTDASPNDYVLAIILKEGDRHIGNVGIHQINWMWRLATGGIAIGEKEYWSKGYGTEAHMLMLDVAFNTFNLRKIASNIYAFNVRSLKSAFKCGHKEIGRRKAHCFKNGEYQDEVLIEVFREEWLPLWEEFENRKAD